MQKNTTLRGKVSKVISADVLEQYTEDGWEVVEGFDQDDIAEVPVDGNQEPMPSHCGSGPYPPGGQHNQRSMRSVPRGYQPTAVQRRYYLVVRDKGMVVTDLRGRIHELEIGNESWNHELEKAQSQYEKKVAELEAKLAQEHEILESVRKRRDEEEDRVMEMRDHTHKLEDHLGKVRQAIGDLKFKEIVGEDKDDDA